MLTKVISGLKSWCAMGKNKGKQKVKNVFKVAGAKSLKLKSKAKAVNTQLKKITSSTKEKVLENNKQLDQLADAVRQTTKVVKMEDRTINMKTDIEKTKKQSDELHKLTNESQVAGGLFWDDVDSLNHRDYVKEARRVIEKCLFKYKPEHVFISFNGGKDCTVLLYLTMQLLRIKHPLHVEPMLSLYIQSPNPFSEVEAFIEKCRQYYNLNVVTINSSVRKGLCTLLTEQPHFKACLMGTRKTDPYSQHLTHFQMTDFGWPQIMRVNPLLNWTYSQIWNFLLSCEAPYCELYDQGYTSLGSRTNTIPNPSLKTIDEVTNVEKYLPAYKLQNGADERSGRL
ncbi:uncharacterized protein CBL_14416 [Carabus blaptoides fortunei]